jgi:hypothetical protein
LAKSGGNVQRFGIFMQKQAKIGQIYYLFAQIYLKNSKNISKMSQNKPKNSIFAAEITKIIVQWILNRY